MQQPQLGIVRVVPDHEHRPHRGAVQFSDPAALGLRVVFAQVAGDDVGHQRFKLRVPSEFACIQRAVLLDHPAHVAGAGIAQHAIRRCTSQQCLDVRHRLKKALASCFADISQHGSDAFAGRCIQLCEGGTARLGQHQPVRARIHHRRFALNQTARLQPAQQPAEVARVEVQPMAQLRSRDALARRQFEQHPRLGEGEVAVQQTLLEHRDPAGVEAVEGADLCDGIGSERRHGDVPDGCLGHIVHALSNHIRLFCDPFRVLAP